ncbi:hypothetical protein [Cohnella zeiphila]|uniref:Uncharacterized protein n=1 Tax=Cohnella zeiphila TaxID=2761120 RepID=A0A7X0SKV7_9BACL|nr:hypothetical protein [Cohnella zeiphila]MBB6731885.1 hypothetical protein [Cohnella zeiphila]
MPAGPVNRTLLESYYQNPGQIYDDTMTEGAYGVLADQIDQNYYQLSSLINSGVLSPYLANMNAQGFMNSNFDIWQRGDSFTGTNIYTADRWVIGNGGGTTTVTKVSVTPGDAFSPYKYFLRFSQTSAGTSSPTLAQRIESVRTYAGMTISVRARIRSVGAGPYTVGVFAIQYFGTGGSPSSAVNTHIGDIVVTNDLQDLVVSATLPTVVGKTIGTDRNDYLAIQFNMPSNFIFDMDFAYVQVNIGESALPYQPRSIGEELLLCQRFYEKSYDLSTKPGTAVSLAGSDMGGALDTASLTFSTPFKVRKRTSPTIQVYADDGTAGAIRNVSTSSNVTSAVIGQYNEKSFRVFFNTSVLTAGNLVGYHWTADAEL